MQQQLFERLILIEKLTLLQIYNNKSKQYLMITFIFVVR